MNTNTPKFEVSIPYRHKCMEERIGYGVREMVQSWIDMGEGESGDYALCKRIAARDAAVALVTVAIEIMEDYMSVDHKGGKHNPDADLFHGLYHVIEAYPGNEE